MITALIFAGGTGRRMKTTDKPKQFLELHGKPVIIYTIEHFERHPEIGNIVVVCLENYINELRHLLEHYNIKKVSLIVSGDDQGGDRSIYNGLFAMRETAKDDDIVLIHDGVRPLINAALINDNITAVKKHGNAITAESASESVVRANNEYEIIDVPPRGELFTAKAPQSFWFGDIWRLYKRARMDGLGTIDSAHLCHIYGVKMHMVKSTKYNMKITFQEDYYVFRALYEAMENRQMLENVYES